MFQNAIQYLTNQQIIRTFFKISECFYMGSSQTSRYFEIILIIDAKEQLIGILSDKQEKKMATEAKKHNNNTAIKLMNTIEKNRSEFEQEQIRLQQYLKQLLMEKDVHPDILYQAEKWFFTKTHYDTVYEQSLDIAHNIGLKAYFFYHFKFKIIEQDRINPDVLWPWE